ncbi:putative quinone oxidoreductase [Microthyrium microscopicum]|uniref:Putative quinone oxidoreductase n=1 Tax=Microthyrium microscopicum TaxID=703497 RepID=A0A6A6UDZ2_9PEZI|nr:putative quinone oxidoreductase [Microthyrium microscopicum]
MSSELKNEAAWIAAEKQHPLELRIAPKPEPTENEVVIKVAYAAVNPTDYKMQDSPYFSMDYPFIFGTDVAGTVVQLGANVTRFRIGQRVIGHCDSLLTRKAANAGFQLYSTCREILVSAVPDSLPLANAAVLPLSVDTASAALFQNLGLPLPSLHPEPSGKTILIWGGSSSVGSSAIQLAVAAGLQVITTASEANFAFVKSLGASEVFNHRDPDSAEQIQKALKEGDFVFDCISSPETQETCGKILGAIGGGTLPLTMWALAKFPDNVKSALVNGLAPGFTESELNGEWGTGAPHIGKAIWEDFMPSALASGQFQAKPDPFVLKGGLGKVQEGIDMVKKGVSAKKIVIELAAEE